MKKLKFPSPSRPAVFLACSVLAVTGVVACDDPPAKTDPAPTAEKEKGPPEGQAAAPSGAASGEPGVTSQDEKIAATKKVVVAPTGTRFDPSVPVTQIPDGAWACDMGGQSHYAAGEKGKCEVCGMHLKQIGGVADTEAAPTDAPAPRAG